MGEGSTYIWRREFGAEAEDKDEGAAVAVAVERDGARTLRFVVVVVGSDAGVDEEAVMEFEEELESIILFWNSRCLFLSLSSGWASRAMPRLYISSACARLVDVSEKEQNEKNKRTCRSSPKQQRTPHTTTHT